MPDGAFLLLLLMVIELLPDIAPRQGRDPTPTHLNGNIFEFANGVEDLAASRGLINDATRDAEFGGYKVACGAEVYAVFRKGVIAYDEYYLEASWRSYRNRLYQLREVEGRLVVADLEG